MLNIIPRLLWPVVPVILALMVLLLRPTDEQGQGLAPQSLSEQVPANARLVVVVVDSLRRATLEAHMPKLHALARGGARLVDVQTCSANFTLPCIQTLLEGRQSPFAAGLHNFTGRSGGSVNFPAMLSAAGLKADLISDHTLGSLYGSAAKSQFDVQTLPEDNLRRDLDAIKLAQKHLRDGSRAIILHVVGTDKVAHYEKPGHPGYVAHFQAVDLALFDLLKGLDPAHDYVLITGDHGHNEDGHHTRDSVALFWGEGFGALWAQIDLSGVEVGGPDATPKLEQTDFLFFLSHPFLLPLPLGYEGRFWSARPGEQPEGHFAAQVEAQRSAFRASGLALDPQDAEQGADVAAVFAKAREAELLRRGDSIWQNLPLLWLYAVFCALGLRWVGGTKGGLGAPDAKAARWIGVLTVAALAVGWWGSWIGWALLVLVPGGLWLAREQGALRALGLVVVLGVCAAFTGRYAEAWAIYFHSTGAFKYQIVVFYVMLAGLGAVFGWLAWRRRVAAWAEGGLLAGFMVLPSGVYYYQFGSSMWWGCLIGAGLSLLVGARSGWGRLKALSAKERAAVGVVGVCTPLMIAQTAGGWEWHHKAVGWLQAMGPGGTLVVGFGVLAVLVWLAGTNHRNRTILGWVVALGGLYSVLVGKMEVAPLVASYIAVLLVVGWLRVPTGIFLRWSEDQTAQRLVLLVFGAGLASQWLLLRGFFIHNIDFTFGLELFSWMSQERDIFMATFLATIPKYGLSVFTMLLVARFYLGADTFRRFVPAVMLLGSLKMLLLLVQILWGMQAHGEQRYELAISELIFIFNYLVMLGTAYGPVVWIARLERQPAEAL